MGIYEGDNLPPRWRYSARLCTSPGLLRQNHANTQILLDLAVLGHLRAIECTPPEFSGSIGAAGGEVRFNELNDAVHVPPPSFLEYDGREGAAATGAGVHLVSYPAQIGRHLACGVGNVVMNEAGYYQTDASAESGSSGGPLIDTSTGRVIGVMSCGCANAGGARAQELAKARKLMYLHEEHFGGVEDDHHGGGAAAAAALEQR